MSSTNHKGSCLCGKTAYEIEGNFDGFFLCHCKHCQKDTGSAHAANLFSFSAKLRWLRGEKEIMIYNLPNTRHMKAFCKHCSSALPSLQMNGTRLIVPAGSLDTEVPIKPSGHIFWASQSSWEKEMPAAPKFDRFPEVH